MHAFTFTTEKISDLATTVMRNVIVQLQNSNYLTEEQTEELLENCIMVVKEFSWWKKLWIKHFSKEENIKDTQLTIVMLRRFGSEIQDRKQTDLSRKE